MLTLHALKHIEGLSQTGRPKQNYATGILTYLKGPDTTGSTEMKWASMQAEKQPENGRASSTKKQNFQINCD